MCVWYDVVVSFAHSVYQFMYQCQEDACEVSGGSGHSSMMHILQLHVGSFVPLLLGQVFEKGYGVVHWDN